MLSRRLGATCQSAMGVEGPVAVYVMVLPPLFFDTDFYDTSASNTFCITGTTVFTDSDTEYISSLLTLTIWVFLTKRFWTSASGSHSSGMAALTPSDRLRFADCAPTSCEVIAAWWLVAAHAVLFSRFAQSPNGIRWLGLCRG